jgi:hypothetical protein
MGRSCSLLRKNSLMNPEFECYIGIDYSGAHRRRGSRLSENSCDRKSPLIVIGVNQVLSY